MNIEIISENTRQNKKFKTLRKKVSFKLKPIPKNTEPVSYFKKSIEEGIQYIVRDLKPDDLVGLTFCNSSLKNKPGYLTFRKGKDLKMADVWTMITNIFQSESEGLSTDTFCLEITMIKPIQA